MADYLEQMFSLKGKTAIVTGATGGLGKSMSVAFAKAGATIVSIELANDPGSESHVAAVRAAGSSVQIFPCDLNNMADLRATYARIWKAGVVPDILLNCAGVGWDKACEDVTDRELDLLFNIDAKATYVSCQEFGRKLLELKRPGKIINVASVTAFQANVRTSAYAATKGAVIQMTKAFSNEWLSRGIQVNAISPGYMLTDLTTAYSENKETNDILMARVPAERWGIPTELDAAALFLAAPSNTFTSGVSVTVDGGFCAK